MRDIDTGTGQERGTRRARRAAVGIILAFSLAVGGAFGLSGCVIEVGNEKDSTTSSTAIIDRPTSTTDSGGATTRSSSVVDVGDGLASPAVAVNEILGPSVVSISWMAVVQGPFGRQEYPTGGTGVIYSSDGMIITNWHVVTDPDGDPAKGIDVTLATGEVLPATIVGRDPVTDLAVIKVDADRDLPVATFVIEQPSVGEYVVAIGYAVGEYENSVTMGIVSGLHRSPDPGTTSVAYNDLIQTDAPISPGNSGGPLANASGQVIGINVLYEPPQTGAVSIGFAIPSAVAVEVADEIIRFGKATHAYLGVSTRTVTSDLQEQFGLSRSTGVLVAQVTPGGPASKAGVQQGDIITEIDGREMVESSDVLLAIRDREPGTTVTVTFDRGGVTSEVTVTLEERPTGL